MWCSSPFPCIHPEKHGMQSALSRGMFPRPRQHLPKFCPSDDFCQGVTVPHVIGHKKIVGRRWKEAVGETTFDGP